MSAYILHLETSTKICSVALSLNGELLAQLNQIGEGYIHGEQLTLMITELLAKSQLSLKDLAAVSYSSGPGSYTGLRIGLSTAKGLCFALSIPLIALPTHHILLELALANDFKNAKKVIALLDARRTEVYMQVFDCQGGSKNELHCALLEQINIDTYLPAIVVGDANEKAKTFWTDPSIQWFDQPICAKYQATLAFKAFEQKAFEDLAYCSPIYLKGANGVLL